LPSIYEFGISATKTKIQLYKQPKIEELSNLLPKVKYETTSFVSLNKELDQQHDFLPFRIANAFVWFVNKDRNPL
jgi:hypothetical protein